MKKPKEILDLKAKTNDNKMKVPARDYARNLFSKIRLTLFSPFLKRSHQIEIVNIVSSNSKLK